MGVVRKEEEEWGTLCMLLVRTPVLARGKRAADAGAGHFGRHSHL